MLICDRDEIIVVAGGSKKEYMNKNNGELIEKAMADRVIHVEKTAGKVSLVDGVEEDIAS